MPSRKVGFIYSDEYLNHVTPSGHPERPDRLRRVVAYLKESDSWESLVHINPQEAHERDILMVHAADHFEYVRSICESGGGVLDEGDTHAVRESLRAASLAIGGALIAIDAVLDQRLDTAFCAVRPPGHHAERNRPMGFCLFNNVAIGARYAQQKHDLEKIAILDWDVHHGNGTQHIFEDDPSVFYISLHQYPFYPGTGARDERGIGRGEGFTLNFPFPAGTGEATYLQAFNTEIVPALERYRPDLLIISAGFDAHRDDPLGGMDLSDDSFAKMTYLIRDICPCISVLEGGYDLDALARSVGRHLKALGENASS